MRVTRFCSLAEFRKFESGEVLINNTDHYKNGKGGSTSRGFCFTEDDPSTAWRYLKGVVCPEVCMVLEFENGGLTPSMGRYADYSNGQDGSGSCLKVEYCTCQYSNKTAKLIKSIMLEDFATRAEKAAIKIMKLMKLSK